MRIQRRNAQFFAARAGNQFEALVDLVGLAVMMMPPAQLPLERFPFMDNPLVVVGALDHPWAQRKRVPVARLMEQTLLTR